jgi:hypothetical protein
MYRRRYKAGRIARITDAVKLIIQLLVAANMTIQIIQHIRAAH